jgi:histidine phosphotransferase ChpT
MVEYYIQEFVSKSDSHPKTGYTMPVELSPRVLELISSRICHDLVSPVGAISNGVELLEEMGEEAGDEAIKLISSSAEQASHRLKCFRLAYGAAGTDKNIGLRDVKEVFAGWLTSGHVQCEFDPALDGKFGMPPRGFFKCVLNLMMFAEECNRGEGKIFVSPLDNGSNGIKIAATGKNVAFREGAEAALKGETAIDDLDARAVHAYITGQFTAHFGFSITHQSQPDLGRVELKISF